MSLQGLVELLRQSKEVESVSKNLLKKQEQVLVGLSGSQKSLFVAATYNPKLVTLVITHSHRQAEVMAVDLQSLYPTVPVSVFSPHELLPHEEATSDGELRQNRMSVLQKIQTPGNIVFASIQALGETLMDPQIFYESTITLTSESEIDSAAFIFKLTALGYERVDMVEAYGQFSVRGGIIDVYPYTLDCPVRIELFDTEVDSIRSFELDSQRSLENVQEVVIYPVREAFYGLPDLQKIRDDIWEEASAQANRLLKVHKEKEADSLLERVAHHLELLLEAKFFPGLDQYLGYLVAPASLFDYLPADARVVINEPVRIKDQLRAYLQEINETIADLLEKGRVLPSIQQKFLTWNDLWEKAAKYSPMYFTVLDKRIPEMEHAVVKQISAKTPEHFQGNLSGFLKKVSQWRKEHYRILLVTSTEERARRLVEYMKDSDIPAQYTADVSKELKIGNCIVAKGSLETGFEFPGFKLIVCTELEIYGKQRPKERIHRSEEHIKLTEGDLRIGDFVVHINHGIGQYLGLETLEVSNAHKDYLLVKFSGKDRLYVPTDQIDMLQRYVGLNDQAPKLSKLGGGEWSRVKKRVKESVQEMAQGLIKLYAEREALQGHAYNEDSPWQQEFEAAFPYEETPDQLQAIRDVKQDMQRSKPMDRLLCGDVGYGKTEVAIRAAFKAVGEGKQVVVLVPTTILAQQHHRTFVERFEEYPINIGVLSRFQSALEQKKVNQGLKAGSMDVVIGTHRLLSKDIKFHDLGLVIVDEEQRFGVAQKERLKELSKNVDVLTLSATPIPRTLHMSMVGVRDMSLIETPPEDRFPIRTFVIEWDPEAIGQAIRREIGRQGQVYFVYNRVQTIDKMYSEIQAIVPDARIAIAHGQMDETRLEKVMLDFYNGEYDVLLCTTIIETGMDISNVNTLIINDADHLGLAQLYQLRGRVGRTNRVAYAYFTYRRDKILTEDAEKRLQAIREFTELGSGIKIAMRDLEIRGAGNILGPEQHGFITSVGFELYCKLLGEAIRSLKGEVVQTPPEPVLDLSVDAYISDEYVSDPKQKVELYKKIIAIRSLSEADQLEEEIEDRFSDLPDAVRNLIEVARIKVLARQVGVASVAFETALFVVKFFPGLTETSNRYTELVRKHRGKIGYQTGRTPRLKVKIRGLTENEALRFLREALAGLKEFGLGGKNE